MRRLTIILALAAVAAGATTAQASAATYAPVNRADPPLSVSKAKLASSLRCSSSLSAGKREPVLLIPGTTLTPEEFSWNYVPALASRGIPYCTVELPGHAMGDIQDAAEYVVNALRTMHRRSGRKVQIIGHSQGGMIGRWALRFWPDTRAMVDDLVGLAPSNHGTIDAQGVCAAPCAPSIWQQRAGSTFLTALNEPYETFRGISYTSVYTHTDEVVVPNLNESGSSSLRTGPGARANIALQQICPLDTSEHLAIGTYDNVAWTLALDAITHAGPASRTRAAAARPCGQPLMPGVSPAAFPGNFARVGTTAGQQLLTYPKVAREPALKCYVFASCPAGFAQARCLDVRGRASGKTLGPVVLGRRRATTRRRLGSKRNRRTRMGLDRWCVRGGGLLTAGYPTTHLPIAVRHALRGQTVVALSSSRRFSASGVKPGQSARTAARRLRHERRIRVGANRWLVAPGRHSTVIVRTRRGRVRTVGIGARSATRGKRAQRLFLAGWHL